MKRVLLPAFALLLAGCGSAPESADPQVRQQLSAQVEAVKAAALGNDRAAAEAALAELNRRIATAQAQGKLAPDNARVILTATDRVAEDVRTIPLPEPPQPVIVTVTPDPPPDVPDEGDPGKHQKDWEKQQKQWQKQRHKNGDNEG
ncbi:hypothetical protein [Saccharopolyspora spinosa]|uniref:Lipoprotein n=1 Tax=Saccharopolyspora spinosa TaxID=60894 RepID=A0A2N3Y870_SACSN|nr:hypothetical protein [Saccharopolyspora spinosa]PKW19061.1 hypothetical protein A8926_7207 [Saccharopolyspora spinosa]